jgi:hypothetical protein
MCVGPARRSCLSHSSAHVSKQRDRRAFPFPSLHSDLRSLFHNTSSPPSTFHQGFFHQEMPAPLQPPAPAVRGVPSLAPAPPPSSQQPSPIDPWWRKTDNETPKTNNGPPSMSSVFQRRIADKANSVKTLARSTPLGAPLFLNSSPTRTRSLHRSIIAH